MIRVDRRSRRRILVIGILLPLTLWGAACVDASRLNDNCQWTDTVSRRLDLSRAADREHLRADVEVAWEVGMRAADLRFRDVPSLSNPIRRACRNPLLDTIKMRHGVSSSDIEHAWTWRVWWADIASVFIPVALLTALAMNRLTQVVRRRLAASGKPALWMTSALAIAVVALFSVGIAQFWGTSVESMRIRDEHIAARAFVVPVVAHPAAAYLGAFLLCFVVAAWTMTRPMSNEPGPAWRFQSR